MKDEMQCKVFSCVAGETEEEEINKWLRLNWDIDIKNITQSESKETFPTVIIWYERKSRNR